MLKVQMLQHCFWASIFLLNGCVNPQPPLAGTKGSSPVQTGSANESVQAKEMHPAMLDPSLANKVAPDEFKVKFQTTKGDFIVKVVRAWSPNGADRFYNLVDIGYYQDVVIFRAIEGFMFQFGIHGDPKVNQQWQDANIKDDPYARVSNQPGYLSFAKGGNPNSRSNQIFVNLGSNGRLDTMGFTPFGQVVEGADVAVGINTSNGENPPEVQGRFQKEGNAFILKAYPDLDIIKSVTFVEDPSAAPSTLNNATESPQSPAESAPDSVSNPATPAAPEATATEAVVPAN